MNSTYNIVLRAGEMAIALSAKLLGRISRNSKFCKFAEGHSGLLEHIREEISPNLSSSPIWIHASSLGEYGVARPIIKQLRQEMECSIIVTFFSPTGCEALRKYHPDVDYVCYLPLDTCHNARTFLDIIRPQKAIFIISEYWINYLSELRNRQIPTYLISAIINDNAPFFKWYGQIFRESLCSFTHIMVLNERSQRNLRRLGYENCTLTGDPLFDNAITIASTAWRNTIIENFAAQGDVFIAGSISDQKDLDLVCTLADNYPDIHFIFVPHEISEEILNNIKFNLSGYALCYSECTVDTDFSKTQVLIIDYLGALAYLYRYGKWAYVGGGFTPYLHSVIEATVYGLPVSFGPRINRKVTPHELIALEIGAVVHNCQDIIRWFDALRNNEEKLRDIKERALHYAQMNSGATAQIIKMLTAP